MTHVILTGAAGFVGSHVLRHLLAKTDFTVACLLTFRHRGMPARVETALADPFGGDWWDRVTFVRWDLTSPADRYTKLKLRLDDCEIIINVASESHVDRSITTPVPFVENNVSLMLNVLELARQAPNLRHLIQFSTDEVYGPVPIFGGSREWDPIVPSNPYSASKACQESLCISYWRTYGVPLIITNAMNIIGETQDPEKFIPLVLRRVLAGETVPIHAAPDGTVGSRFYLHARNAADALLHLLNQITDDTRWVGGTTETLRYGPGADRPLRFNVVGEREVDNLTMARMVADAAAGRELKYELVDFHTSRPGHDLRYALDGSRLASFGWKPPINLDRSLRRTVEWTLQHPEWLT